MINKEEKLLKLKEAEKEFNKKFGKNSLNSLESKSLDIEAIPTGSIGLDKATGIGGFPKGRIVEIFGWESTAKTTVCQHVVAECQKSGGLAAYVDAEQALDKHYAKAIGINLEELTFFQPESGEEGLNYVEALLDLNIYDVIVVDSVAALTPQAEIEGEIGESKIGLQARMMSQAMRKLTSKVSKSNTCLIFINQFREKIGVMFGDPSVTVAGNALKFFASIRIEMSKSVTVANSVVENGKRVSNLIKYKIVKNKVAPPFEQGEFYVKYGVGIDKDRELLELGKDLEIYNIRANTFTYGDIKIKFDDLSQLIEDNAEMFEEIKQKIRNSIL